MTLPRRPRFPALSNDEVPSTRERDRVAIVSGRKIDTATGLVVLGIVLAAGELITTKLKVGGIVNHGSRSGERANNCPGGNGEVSKGNHDSGDLR